MDIIIDYKLNAKIENIKNSYEGISEGIMYEELLRNEEQRIRKLSGMILTLKLQCEKFVNRIDILEREKNILKSYTVRS